MDNGESVRTEWSGPSDIPGERYSVFDHRVSGMSSLTISPLAEEDDGTYTCTGIVTGGDNVQQATASHDVTLTVLSEYILDVSYNYMAITLSTALPPPVVFITHSGSPTAGQFYTLSCSVEVVPNLVVEPSIVWTRQGDVPINNNYHPRLKILPLRTSDGSYYTCTASVDIPNVVSVSGADSTDLVVASKCECEQTICNMCVRVCLCTKYVMHFISILKLKPIYNQDPQARTP